MHQIRLLIGPVVRIVPWVPLAAAAALAVLALLPALAGAPAPGTQVWGLRIAAVTLGAGASFAMVDPMAPLSVTPTPRWLRQWLRVSVAVLPGTAVWLGLFVLASRSLPDGDLPFAGLAAEAAACALAGVAGAAVAARRRHTMTVAGPATQGGLIAVTLFLTGRHSAWPLPAAAGWDAVHMWWAAAVPLLLAVLAGANRDTAVARRGPGRLRPARWPSGRGPGR
jgi:hypothetical protein